MVFHSGTGLPKLPWHAGHLIEGVCLCGVLALLAYTSAVSQSLVL